MPTLREIREERFLSQRELAERAKVSRTTVAMIEAGQTRPYPRTARLLAEALGIPPGEVDWPKGEDAPATTDGAAATPRAGDGD